MKRIICILMLASCSAFAQTPILLHNVNLIDGTGKSIQTNKSVLIVGDRIQRVIDSNEQVDLENVQEIDLSGKFLLPGLFDSHVHFGTDPTGKDNLEDTKKRLAVFLKHGVTGVRDMAGDTRQLVYLARQSELDEIASPTLYFSSLMAGSEFFDDPRTAASGKGRIPGETSWMKAITDETDIVRAVAEAKGTGATGIKIYADLSAHLSKKVIEEARRQDFMVWAHASVIPTMPQELIDAGVNGVSHSPLLAWEVADKKPENGKQRYNETDLNVEDPRFKALLKSMAERQVYLDPTVQVYAKRKGNTYKNGVKATKAAFEAGVQLIVGTDMNVEGENIKNFPLVDEMEAWVKIVGIPPMEVIKAATYNAAQFLRIGDKTGSIEVGKKADIVILNSDPIEDMANLMKIHSVYKNGKKVN